MDIIRSLNKGYPLNKVEHIIFQLLESDKFNLKEYEKPITRLYDIIYYKEYTMKACLFRLTFCVFMFICMLPFTAFCDNQTKEFPEYHCRLTLPVETWSWDENLGIPNLFAIAESPEGYLLLFGACAYNGNYPVNDKFIAGIEKGRLGHPGRAGFPPQFRGSSPAWRGTKVHTKW